MTRAIATFFYVGLMPKAPGTWGSLAALPFAFVIHLLGGFWLLVICCLIAFLAGWWATLRETAGKENHDPGEIVIDEVVGQWITLMPVSAALTALDDGWLPLWLLVSGFALFRLFDITKPGLVGTMDRLNTALGVMLDDVVAGIIAALALTGLMAVVSLVV